MQELGNIFQNLAFPVAVCIVLFYVCFLTIKKENTQNEEFIKQALKTQEQHTNYLQNQNARLATIIKENTKAFNMLCTLLEYFKIKEKTEGVWLRA